jgi:hypothetical protein
MVHLSLGSISGEAKEVHFEFLHELQFSVRVAAGNQVARSEEILISLLKREDSLMYLQK